ncbi:MAG: helix-turn-helix domain-containing protein, partial [Candidatus Nitrosopolaris sp.]
RSRWWAYKWLKRFAESGLAALKNLPRAGRPPEVSEERFAEIKRIIFSQYNNSSYTNNNFFVFIFLFKSLWHLFFDLT